MKMKDIEVDLCYQNFGLLLKSGSFRVIYPGGMRCSIRFKSRDEAIAFIDSVRKEFKDNRKPEGFKELKRKGRKFQ